MSRYYILDGKVPVPATLLEWGNWMEKAERRVKRTEVNGKDVSTVFLGLDHGLIPNRAPILFETMVFGLNDYREEYCQRYATWEEAEAGHEKAVQWVEAGCKDD